MEFFTKGVILGFSIAAPVGPIGVLCIRRTLQYGRWSGFASGLGAAAADTLYGVVAAFGLTLVSDFLLEQQVWLRILGGAFLIWLGIRTFLLQPQKNSPEIPHTGLIRDFFSTLFLTLTNPMTILSYIAIFAALGLRTSSQPGDASLLVSGVFVGSAAWWLILSEGITWFRKKISEQLMGWINRIAGVLIISFGLATWVAHF